MLCVSLTTACAPELTKLPRSRSARGSLGQEVYKLLCRRLAGVELPRDLDGRESEQLCLAADELQDAELAARRAELPPRLVALAERRQRFVQAVDVALPAQAGDALEQLLRGLVPYYRPPEELVQQGSRSLARLLDGVASDDDALLGFARYTRAGMAPAGAGSGLTRALTSHEGLSETLRSLLPILLDGDGAEDFRALRSALALELATSAPKPGDPDNQRLRTLLARRDTSSVSAFASGQALHVALRDKRGMPRPKLVDGQLPFPFVDLDGDARADLSTDRFVLEPGFAGELPEPYPVIGEGPIARDTLGRACALGRDGRADCSRLLYEYGEDSDQTLLSALLREASQLFSGDQPPFASLLALLGSLLEPATAAQKSYQAARLDYHAVDVQNSLLLDLLHGSQAALASSSYDDSYALLDQLLSSQEPQLAVAVAPLLQLEKRTRPDADSYPLAVLSQPNTFWDELLFELEKLARLRVAKGAESALEGLLRAALGYARDTEQPGKPITRILPLERASHTGALIAQFMRYKDDWRANPRARRERKPDEPATIGTLRTPVDRSQPDTPVSCGRDGCGGPIAGSPFEPFRLDGQVCLIEHTAHVAGGADCGAASNQSLFQRGLGLLWEVAGRSQCNRAISIAELIDQAIDDPCANLGRNEPCRKDSDCALIDIFSSDYVCDTARQQCIAKPGTTTCAELVRRQKEARDTASVLAEQAIALDYQCPSDVPSAPCQAYKARYPAAFIDTDGQGPKVAALQPCHILDLPDVGRTFGRSLTREFTLQVPNPWVRRFLEDVARAGPVSATDNRKAIPDCDLSYRMLDPTLLPACIPGAARVTRELSSDVPPEVNTLAELVEHLLEDPTLFGSPADERDMRPDVKALARVLFTPSGKDSVLLFEPMLIRAAPPICAAATGLPACPIEDTQASPTGGCCIADRDHPPLRYRLDTYYGATTFAWEHSIELSDGNQLSLLEALRPIADVFNRNDTAPASAANFEDADYGLTRLGGLLAQHYDSAQNPRAQSSNPATSWYRKQTGLVRYEALVADLLDSGTVAPAQLAPHGAALFAQGAGALASALDAFRPNLTLLETLAGLTFSGGRDGLDLLGSIAELYLNPHTFCAGEGGDDRLLSGGGACALATGEGGRAALSFRDGRDHPCWNGGRCFDGKSPATPKRFVSPLYLLLEPLHTLYGRSDADPRSEHALRSLAAGLLDRFFAVQAGHFADRPFLALLRAFVSQARERRAEEKQAGTLDDHAQRSLADLREDLVDPTLSLTLRLLQTIGRDDTATTTLASMGGSLLAPDNQRPLLVAVGGLLETLDGSPLLSAMSRRMGGALVTNLPAVLSGSEPSADVDNSLLAHNLTILQRLAEVDDGNVLGKTLHNLGSQSVPSSGNGASPLEVLSEILFAVNRADAARSDPLDAADLASTFARTAELMNDDKRGFERLYAVLQCATTSPRPASCKE